MRLFFLDSNLIPSNQILCLIPMKNVQDAKKRLRISFPSEKQSAISNIVTKLFLNTISTVKIFVDFAVVSPSEEILELALDHGSSFVYQDLGIDLNDALSTSINYAFTIGKWQYILILTADLPFLTNDAFAYLRKFLFKDSITILSAPSKDSKRGTSGLLIPLSLWDKFHLQFGQNSFNRFIGQFNDQNYSYKIIHDRIGFDLDTIDDLNELRSSVSDITKLFSNQDELNKLFST